LFRIKKA